MDTANRQSRRTARHRPREGPFAPALDPIAEARASLVRGVKPQTVAHLFISPAIRRRRLADLRTLLAECGADGAFEAALDAEMRARGEAA